MSLDELVRTSVREYNAELSMQAWVAAATGVLWSVVVYAFILVVCFFFFCLSAAPWYLVGTGIFAIFFAVSWWSCKRGDDPGESLTPVGDQDATGIALAYLVTGLPMSPRHTVAGAADLLMYGPANMIEARSMLKNRLPTDASTLRSAAAVLGRLLEGRAVMFEDIEPKAAAMVLVRVGLAKPDRSGSTLGLVVTVKARESSGDQR